MRLARWVGAVVVLVLTLTLATAGLNPAQAAKPKHDLVAKGYEQGSSDRFFVKGKVTTFPRGKIRLMRNVNGKEFEVYDRIRTRASGKFKARIFQVGDEKTCFKVQVPGTDVYRKTTSQNLGCITRD